MDAQSKRCGSHINSVEDVRDAEGALPAPRGVSGSLGVGEVVVRLVDGTECATHADMTCRGRSA